MIKKYLFCRWFHDDHRCFPETWDRGLEGPWHCRLCHPCDEDLLLLFEAKKHKRLKFYWDKARMVASLLRMREWKIAREQWSVSYMDYLRTVRDFPEIEKSAIKRLMKALEEDQENERA